jgi:hypothetical protein
MKKNIYLENTERQIIRQMKWANVHTKTERDAFLDYIIAYCQKMKLKPFYPPKSQKTRHG